MGENMVIVELITKEVSGQRSVGAQDSISGEPLNLGLEGAIRLRFSLGLYSGLAIACDPKSTGEKHQLQMLKPLAKWGRVLDILTALQRVGTLWKPAIRFRS